ncbi:MAG: hypothetical protein OXE41_09985 [Gammaproteobacteria bacterium]|nr:hypothetical protein [Gammaproteobacteria bacterium]MCY4275702.1 hypothetical protein [Gammaproteobacteria bacterium]
MGGSIGVLLAIRRQFDYQDIGVLWMFLCVVIVSSQMVINRELGLLSHPIVSTLLGGLVPAMYPAFVAGRFSLDKLGFGTLTYDSKIQES